MKKNSVVVSTLKAAGQLTPVTAAIVSAYNDRAENEKSERLQQTFDVIFHRIGKVVEEHERLDEILASYGEIISSGLLEKSELHAKLGGLLIANSHIRGGTLDSSHYSHKLLSLSYIELVVLLEKGGYISSHMDFEPAVVLSDVSDGLKNSILSRLEQDFLISSEGLPKELEALLDED